MPYVNLADPISQSQPRSSRSSVKWFLTKTPVWLDISRCAICRISHEFECLCTPTAKGMHDTGSSWPNSWLGVYKATDMLAVPGH